MPEQALSSSRSWLTSPLKTAAGHLKLAGAIKDIPGIRPHSMRVLGSYALIYMASGKGYFTDGKGTSRSLDPGDAIIVFPEIPHAYGPLNDGTWTQIYVVFEGPQFELLRASSILDPVRPVWHLEPVDYWRRRLEEIFQTPTSQGEATALRALGRFVHLLTDMAATDSEASRRSEDVWLDDSMHLLSEPRARGWLSPQEVAPRVGLSYENFRKLFAQRVGESPAKFQKRRRIEHACAAIYQETATFKELAEELGFCDVYHFSKVFRQIMGESPSAFRKKTRGV